jgi:hypothetical protein
MRALLTLGLFLSLPLAAQPATVDEIVAKYTAARGGLERWRAVSALEISGTYTSFSKDAPFTLQRKRPDLYRFESATLAGPFTIGNDASGLWWVFPLQGAEPVQRVDAPDYLVFRDQLSRDAQFEPPLLGWKEKGYQVALLSPGDIDGQPTVRLELTPPKGPKEVWHLDPKTGLERAIDSTVYDYSQKGESMPMRTFFSDFRPVGGPQGIVLPHHLEQEYGARFAIFSVEKVRLDPPLVESAFAMPPPPPAPQKEEEAPPKP